MSVMGCFNGSSSAMAGGDGLSGLENLYPSSFVLRQSLKVDNLAPYIYDLGGIRGFLRIRCPAFGVDIYALSFSIELT
jgi:hypothetical protein